MSLTGWIKKHGADKGQLDILVEDVLCQRAIRINGRGLKAQVRFLKKTYHSELLLKKLIWHELQVLQRVGMKMQSKVIPENNIRRSDKKKRGVR